MKRCSSGVLVVDDSTLDKPYAEKMTLVQRHWSGKHYAVVEGINLITLLWTNGDRHVPVGYRVYDKAGDALTKNDHFQHLLAATHERDFRPECVVFDSWYSGLENLKQIRGLGRTWLRRDGAVGASAGGLPPSRVRAGRRGGGERVSGSS